MKQQTIVISETNTMVVVGLPGEEVIVDLRHDPAANTFGIFVTCGEERKVQRLRVMVRAADGRPMINGFQEGGNSATNYLKRSERPQPNEGDKPAGS